MMRHGVSCHVACSTLLLRVHHKSPRKSSHARHMHTVTAHPTCVNPPRLCRAAVSTQQHATIHSRTGHDPHHRLTASPKTLAQWESLTSLPKHNSTKRQSSTAYTPLEPNTNSGKTQEHARQALNPDPIVCPEAWEDGGTDNR